MAAPKQMAALIPTEAATIVEWLHRTSGGGRLVLRRLIEELATGNYDVSNPYSRDMNENHQRDLLASFRRIDNLMSYENPASFRHSWELAGAASGAGRRTGR
jgi:hypothetical protein